MGTNELRLYTLIIGERKKIYLPFSWWLFSLYDQNFFLIWTNKDRTNSFTQVIKG